MDLKSELTQTEPYSTKISDKAAYFLHDKLLDQKSDDPKLTQTDPKWYLTQNMTQPKFNLTHTWTEWLIYQVYLS